MCQTSQTITTTAAAAVAGAGAAVVFRRDGSLRCGKSNFLCGKSISSRAANTSKELLLLVMQHFMKRFSQQLLRKVSRARFSPSSGVSTSSLTFTLSLFLSIFLCLFYALYIPLLHSQPFSLNLLTNNRRGKMEQKTHTLEHTHAHSIKNSEQISIFPRRRPCFGTYTFLDGNCSIAMNYVDCGLQRTVQ